MYKTLGGYSWTGLFVDPVTEECSITDLPENVNVPLMDTEESMKHSAQQFHLALESVKSVIY